MLQYNRVGGNTIQQNNIRPDGRLGGTRLKQPRRSSDKNENCFFLFKYDFFKIKIKTKLLKIVFLKIPFFKSAFKI